MRKALITIAFTAYAVAESVPTRGAYFSHKTVIIPADEKINRAGEDAAEASEDFLVLADGVGGWANQGIDPGFYSRHLVSQL
jgi:serine/threonine protein phosphatase PrpC